MSDLPRSFSISIALGLAYGIALWLLLFSESWLSSGLVSIAFLVVVPLTIGFMTVSLGAEERKTRWLYVIFAPWLAIVVFLLTSAVFLGEGAVCIALASPLFLALSSVGGIVSHLVRRWRLRPRRTLYSLALLPLLLSPLERSAPPGPAFDAVLTEVTIAADPAIVWSQITDVAPITNDELSWSLTRLLGIPQPVEAHMTRIATGWVRNTRWERGVSFREIVTDSREGERLQWTFDFPASAVPDGVLDDHVRIGGRYFQLSDGGYTLAPAKDGGTRLTLRSSYRVTARPSLYARYWAYLIMNDFHGLILDLIRDRSERAAANRNGNRSLP